MSPVRKTPGFASSVAKDTALTKNVRTNVGTVPFVKKRTTRKKYASTAGIAKIAMKPITLTISARKGINTVCHAAKFWEKTKIANTIGHAKPAANTMTPISCVTIIGIARPAKPFATSARHAKTFGIVPNAKSVMR